MRTDVAAAEAVAASLYLQVNVLQCPVIRLITLDDRQLWKCVTEKSDGTCGAE